MIHRDEPADTPDWTPCAGNTCGGCARSWNLCNSLRFVDKTPCCTGCTHCFERETRPLLWDGDQA